MTCFVPLCLHCRAAATSEPADLSGGNEAIDLESGDNPEARGAGGGSQPMGKQATSNESEHGGSSEQMGSIQGGGEGGMAAAAATSRERERERATQGGS